MILTRRVRSLRRVALAAVSGGDAATSDGRSRDRLRAIVLSVGASGLSRLVTIGAMLVTVPLTLHYLGQERYGIWAVISSFSVMLAFADMGLGNGVLNAVSRANGMNDPDTIRSTISSGYAMLSVLGLAIAAVFLLALPHVDWSRLFNVHSARARGEAGPALTVFVLLFACTVPATLIQKIQFGLQQGFVSSLWQCVGSVLTLLFVVTAVLLRASLPWLVAALLTGPLLASLFNTLVFFRRGGAALRPSPRLIRRDIVRATLGAGLLFFLLQLLASLAFGSDPIIITQVLDAKAVAGYAVPDRMFSLIPMLLNMLLAPLWPAYGEAVTRGDHQWVRTALMRTTLAAATGAAGLSVVFVLAGPLLLRLWVGPEIAPGLLLLCAMGGWKVVEAVNITLSIYMNGTGLLKVQTAIALASCTAMVVFKIVLTRRLGVAGIPLGALLGALPLSTVPVALVIRRRLHAPRPSAAVAPL